MFEDNDSDLPRKKYLYSPENLGDQTPTLIPLFEPENGEQYIGVLPPRHRRPRCQQADTTAGTQITGDTVSFPIPSHSVSEQDVQDTITRMGFKEHVFVCEIMTYSPVLRYFPTQDHEYIIAEGESPCFCSVFANTSCEYSVFTFSSELHVRNLDLTQ